MTQIDRQKSLLTRRSIVLNGSTALIAPLFVSYPLMAVGGPQSPEEIDFVPQPSPLPDDIGETIGSPSWPSSLSQAMDAFADLLDVLAKIATAYAAFGIAAGVGVATMGGGLVLIPGGQALGAGLIVSGGVTGVAGALWGLIAAGLFGASKGLYWLSNDPPRKLYKTYPKPIKDPKILFSPQTDFSNIQVRTAIAVIKANSDIYCTLASLEHWQGAKLANDEEWMENHAKTWTYFILELKESLPDLISTLGELVSDIQVEYKKSGESVGAAEKQYLDVQTLTIEKQVISREINFLKSVTGIVFSESWYYDHVEKEVLADYRLSRTPISGLLSLDPNLPAAAKHLKALTNFGL